MALASDFDIDLTLIPRASQQRYVVNQRESQKNHLFTAKYRMQFFKDQGGLSWYVSSYVYYFVKLPVPFLKITLHRAEFAKKYNIRGMEKIDITVGNTCAVRNSEIISAYADNYDIACFTLLVKKCAKRNLVINSKEPMKGLSAYGVVLMSIFFLIESGQIPRLAWKSNFETMLGKLKVYAGAEHPHTAQQPQPLDI